MKKLMLINLLLKTVDAVDTNTQLLFKNINADEVLKEGGLDFIKDFSTINYLQVEILERIKKELDDLADAEAEALYQLKMNS
jgi:hypothetical protein